MLVLWPERCYDIVKDQIYICNHFSTSNQRWRSSGVTLFKHWIKTSFYQLVNCIAAKSNSLNPTNSNIYSMWTECLKYINKFFYVYFLLYFFSIHQLQNIPINWQIHSHALYWWTRDAGKTFTGTIFLAYELVMN